MPSEALAAGGLQVYLRAMRAMSAFALAAGLLLVAPAAAQQRSYDIMVEEGGKPLKKRTKPVVEPVPEAQKKSHPKPRVRGSGYVPPTGLPKTEAITTPQAPGVYRPPAVNSFGDRVINCNHSFSLNAGIGNNPTDRGSYVRQCAN